MNAMLAEVTARLEASGRAIDALVAGVGPELARFRPAEGKWSILEVLGHLADEERRDFRARVEAILHHPGAPWVPIDPERWVREGHFNEQKLDALRNDFVQERTKSVAWLKTLHDANWSAVHRHPTLGEFTAESMLCAWAAHDLLHLRQIERLLYLHLARMSRPDRLDYAGAW
jgi:hypothetical protein